jgi:tetratricopeptide (TPR) repeat protein
MRIALLVLLSLGIAMPAVAQKQPSKKAQVKAKAIYDEGLRFYNIGEYQQAIARFKESYVVVPAPLLLFNIAQAYRLAGDCDQALRSYRTYLREVPKPANKDQVDKAIAICEKVVATPDPQPVEPAPVEPRPPVVASAPTDEDGGEDAEVEDDSEEPEARPGRVKRIAGIALGVTGVAIAVTGVYFGLRASSQASDIEGFDGVWDEDWESTEKAQKRNAVLGPVLIGVGLGAIAGGAVLYIMGHREAEEAAGDTEVSLAPTGDGGALVVSGRW